MASFQKYDTKQGQKWLFKMDTGINPDTGKRQTTTRRGYKTKKEAQAAAAQLEQELVNGIKINHNNLTFQDVFDQWHEVHSTTVKLSTKKSIQSKFKRQILPRFGKLKIKDISKTYCQQQVNEMSQQINSVKEIKMYANQVFKYALRMDLISKNPMDHVIIPKQASETIVNDPKAQERNYWNKEELKAFLAISSEELTYRDYVLFHLLIYTGARKGELLSLSWDDIDFAKGSIHLGKTLIHHNGSFVFQTPKTKDSKRLISIDNKTLTLLKKWRIRQNESILAYGINKEYENIIFSREDGTPMRLVYLNEKINALIKKHNLHKISIHGLRHTHASLLLLMPLCYSKREQV